MDYVLVRKEGQKHSEELLERAYETMRKHGIVTGRTIISTPDNKRHGPVVTEKDLRGDDNLIRELDELGFCLKGPFREKGAAVHFWYNASTDRPVPGHYFSG